MNKNMLLTEPPYLRVAKYGEHRCFIFNNKNEYVGALYLDAKMRRLWRKQGFGVMVFDL